MNKLWIGLCALVVTGFAACSSDQEEYFGFLRNANGQTVSEVVLYADQPSEMFYVVASEAWTASTSIDWGTISPTEFTQRYYSTPITVTPSSVNNTGKLRTGLITVKLSKNTLATDVYHLPWHNITSPSINRERKHELTLSTPNAATVPFVFTTYQDGGKLTSSDTWITVDTTFAKGAHNVSVTIARNTGDVRTGTVMLTSGGVSTPITVIQPKRN